MEISEQDYMEYMNLLERGIKDAAADHRALRGLADTEETRASIAARQHRYFIKWYRMNERLIAEGRSHYIGKKIAEIGGLVVGARYKDIILESKEG